MKSLEFLTSLIIPLVMLLTGLIFMKWAPRSVNTLFGYRTRRSMQNDDTWVFANRLMAHIWIHWSLSILAPTIIVMYIVLYFFPDYLGQFSIGLTLVQLVLMIASIYPIEKALKENFDEKGRRRNDG